MSVQLGFDETLFAHLDSKQKVKQVKVKKVKTEYVVSNEMSRILFPEDYTAQEHIEALMSFENVVWCAEDVYYFQKRLLHDAEDILGRMNSSLKEIDECLSWAFTENPSYDFSVDTCLNNQDFDNLTAYQQRLLSILCKTHRQLVSKNRKSDQKRISFIRKCMAKCRNKLEDANEFIQLNSLERACL